MMGRIVAGWLLFWEAGVAAEKLEAVYSKKKVDRDDRSARDALIKDDRDVAFYEGKLSGRAITSGTCFPISTASSGRSKAGTSPLSTWRTTASRCDEDVRDPGQERWIDAVVIPAPYSGRFHPAAETPPGIF